MHKKKILILGASSDIGLQTVKKFLSKGWFVFAHYNKTNNKLRLIKNPNLKLFKYNLKDINKFSTYVKKNKLFSNIDSFISLTGYLEKVSFFKINSKNFMNHINVNYFSNIVVLQKLLPNMKKRKFGRILLSSSIGVKFGGSNDSIIYSLTKHMNEFFFSSYKKFYENNILINTLRIGVTNTKIHKKKTTKDLKRRVNLIPLKRMASSKEIAEYLYFYGSENNTFSTNSIIETTGGE